MRLRGLIRVFFVHWITTATLWADPWIAAQKAGELAYFLETSPSQIRRFNFNTGLWLLPLPLKGPPTAMLIDSNAVYVAFGRSTFRYSPDMSEEIQVATTGADVTAILSGSNHVYIVHSTIRDGQVTSIRKSDGIQIATTQIDYRAFAGASISPSLGQIYGRTVLGHSILGLNLNSDGTFVGALDSPPGQVPDASRTWVIAGGQRIVDNSGTVYKKGSPAPLFSNTIGEPFDTLDSTDNYTLVLRTNTVFAYDSLFLPTGKKLLNLDNPKSLFIFGTNVFVFAPTSGDPATRVVPLGELIPATPENGIDPRGLAYVPDALIQDRTGDLLLHVRKKRSVFRWSRANRDYGPTITLNGDANKIAYSAEHNRLYLNQVLFGDGSTRIDQVNLNGSPVQSHFADLPAEVLGLAAADPYLFICDATKPFSTHRTYTSDGRPIAENSFNFSSEEYIWSAVNRRVYYLWDSAVPNDLVVQPIAEDGNLGAKLDSPYHGELTAKHPVRVSPDARLVLIGSGELCDGATLRRRASLANPVTDAVWVGTFLYTLRGFGAGSQIQKWSTNNFEQTDTGFLSGTPLRIFSDPQGLLVVTLDGTMPRFWLLDDPRAIRFASRLPPTTPVEFRAQEVGHDTIRLAWGQGDKYDTTGFAVEQFIPATGKWAALATLPLETTNLLVSQLSRSTLYQFRLKATNSLGVSDYVGPLEIKTLSDPDAPQSPTGLNVVEALASQVELAWTDRSNNEIGYFLERQNLTLSGAWTRLQTLPMNATTFIDRSVTPKTSYQYRVIAFNDLAIGEPSNLATVTTLAGDGLPPNAPPSSFRVSQSSTREVRLSWVDDSSNETGFIIERFEPGGNPIEIGRTERNATNFVDATFASQAFYVYQISAFNSFGRLNPPLSATIFTPGSSGSRGILSQRFGSEVLFVINDPPRIERFDLDRRSWNPPVPLTDGATAFLALPEAWYLAFGRKVVKLDPTTGAESFVANHPSGVTHLFVWKEILYVASSAGPTWSYDRQRAALIDESGPDNLGYIPGAEVENSTGNLFGVTLNSTPPFIVSQKLAEDGRFLNQSLSGANPFSQWSALFPDGGRVVASNGRVYSNFGSDV